MDWSPNGLIKIQTDGRYTPLKFMSYEISEHVMWLSYKPLNNDRNERRAPFGYVVTTILSYITGMDGFTPFGNVFTSIYNIYKIQSS